MRHMIAIAGVLALAGCNPAPTPDSPEQNGATPLPMPTSEAPTPSPSPSPINSDALTATGWGPLRIGMTRAEVVEALGADANPNAVGGPDPEACDIFRPSRAPKDMLVMLEQGKLTRISLGGDAKTRTQAGIGIGDTEAAVRAAYGDRIVAEPHKYVEAPAKYLTVWNGKRPTESFISDPAARGIRFETDKSAKLTAIHAGGPSIQYVEGCL